MKPLRSVAIIDHIGGFSLPYTFELAEAVARNGVEVDLYINASPHLEGLPEAHRYRRLAVLGSPLLKHWKELRRTGGHAAAPSQPSAVRRGGRADKEGRSPYRTRPKWFEVLRERALEIELAAYLRLRNYDLVWTHWPNFYCSGLWKICQSIGLKTAHTVHDVLPHDRFPEGSPSLLPYLRNVYGHCDFLFAHSESSKNELLSYFPEFADRVIVYPHGISTSYPRRPEARGKLRRELGIEEGQIACLMCGAIVRYKNVESVLGALADARCAGSILIVAGKEFGYAGCSDTDALARTRRVAHELGVSNRARFIPGYLPISELSELFEAADILMLPYLKTYGSGLLLLGMTFEKYIVATPTGGAEEYLAKYPRHTLLKGIDVSEVATGLAAALRAVRKSPSDPIHAGTAQFEWPAVARDLINQINRRL